MAILVPLHLNLILILIEIILILNVISVLVDPPHGGRGGLA
jgi:hypothetical protein